MNKNSKQALELYIERAKKLETLTLTTYIREKGQIGIETENHEDGTYVAKTQGPTDNDIYAFVSIARPFLQQKPISFQSMSSICDDPEVSPDWKTEFSHIRNRLNQYLDERFAEGPQEAIPTRREIFHTFTYGDILHIDDAKKRKKLKEWESRGFDFLILVTEFNLILVALLNLIMQVAQLCERELHRDTSI